jgi:hypothetical protein
MDREGNATMGYGHLCYTEVARQGNVFAVCNQSGITTQAGLSATTPALTLFNPVGSGKNGALLWAGVTFTVAFAAAAVVWLAVNTNLSAAAVTGTATTTDRNTLLGGSGGHALTPLLAATLPAAPVGLCVLGVGLTGAITTTPQIQAIGRQFDGSIILQPGSAISIQTSTASGASATFCEFIWEEIPV